MTSKEKEDVYKAARSNGYNDAKNGPGMLNGYGGSVKFEGSNRTRIDGTVYYGASDAKKKLNNK